MAFALMIKMLRLDKEKKIIADSVRQDSKK